MRDWRDILAKLQEQAGQAVQSCSGWRGRWSLASLGMVSCGWSCQARPTPCSSEGLSPSDGGKIIAQLQKLGIAYQLQAAGNVILVPAPQLAQARLQLGAGASAGLGCRKPPGASLRTRR